LEATQKQPFVVLSFFHGTSVGAGSPDSLPPLVLTMVGALMILSVEGYHQNWRQQNLVAIDLAGSS
jgi:hypothetical protein